MVLLSPDLRWQLYLVWTKNPHPTARYSSIIGQLCSDVEMNAFFWMALLLCSGVFVERWDCRSIVQQSSIGGTFTDMQVHLGFISAVSSSPEWDVSNSLSHAALSHSKKLSEQKTLGSVFYCVPCHPTLLLSCGKAGLWIGAFCL